jgi:hypothetical protein
MISSSQCRHYDLFQSLYQHCRADWEEWNQTHDIETESVNAGDVYQAKQLDDRCGWWGVPLVHFYKRTKWSEQWPRTYSATKDVPGIIHVAINFTKPGCTIPVHQDKVDRINDRVIELVPTLIGIRIPSDNIDTVGFEIDQKRIYIGEGDIVSFLPEQPHGSWNFSSEWRVTLYITSERTHWQL